MIQSMRHHTIQKLIAEGKTVAESIATWHTELAALFWTQAGKSAANEPDPRIPAGLMEDSEVTEGHYYPFLFADAFPRVSPEKVRQVAIAGHLYAKHLVIQDRLIDDQMGKENPEKCLCILLADLLHEKSLAILHALFIPDSSFWRFLQDYHREFVRAVFLETIKHKDRISSYTEEERRQIAIGKSALAKAATAALAVLANQGEKISRLAASQDWFADGMQLYDDLKDWKKDFQLGQYSHLLNRILIEGGFAAETRTGSKPSIKSIGQVLYYSGMAEELLDRVDRACLEAIGIVEEIRCPGWIEYIESRRAECHSLKADLNQIRKKTTAIYLEPAQPSETSIPSAIERGVRFLVSGQRAEGCWSDFRNSAGESTDWVTGYVGAILKRIKGTDETVAKSSAWLRENRFPQGGWGYHRGVVMDADSTAWCLSFLADSTADADVCVKAATALLEFHKPAEGGFSTYADPDPIREYMGLERDTDITGWTSSHLCVTAAAVQALLHGGWEAHAPVIQAALEFIRRRQHQEGYWESYWWDGRMYGTCQSVMALSLSGAVGVERHCRRAVRWLSQKQSADGGWNNGSTGISRPFYTALAVRTLIKAGSGKKAEAAVQRGIAWLLREQASDGSWRSYPVLRIPFPWDHLPWEEKEWREDHNGSGIIIRDHHRFFTTATVLEALSLYRREERRFEQSNGNA